MGPSDSSSHIDDEAKLTVYFAAVGTAVKEDTSSLSSAVVNLVVVDLDVVTALGGDNTCERSIHNDG